MRVQYVEFAYPGAIISESVHEQAASRTEMVKHPKGCYAYRFIEREEVVVDDETLVGKFCNPSGWRFFGGELFTLARVKEEMPNEHIMLSNMERNGYSAAVRCRAGFIPLFVGDEILTGWEEKP